MIQSVCLSKLGTPWPSSISTAQKPIRHLSEDIFPHLPTARHGEHLQSFTGTDPEEMAGCLLRGERGPDPVDEVSQQWPWVIWSTLEERSDSLAVLFVLDADNACLVDSLVLQEPYFDFVGIDVLSPWSWHIHRSDTVPFTTFRKIGEIQETHLE